jgi:GntR family transcriptional regulator
MTRLSIQLSQASGVPFYRQVVDQIADLLRTGSLPPGFQLPSVRELAVHLRVSLITTRRAYADLEAAGLIVSKHGQGTFVAEGAPTASRRQSIEEARQQLATAVHRARLLGLRGTALRQFIDKLLEQEDDTHGS